MNILVPHSWLLDFLKTSTSPEKLARSVSLCGPSFERSHKVGRDTVYDIEVTTNRPDTASVVGIAREAATILPEFKLRAKFVDPYPAKTAFAIQTTKALPIRIKAAPDTVLRFTAIVVENIEIKKSPAKTTKRLEAVGIRPINNIVDLTNYLMVETGQPLHAFDYDSIEGHIASIELSKKGETVTTLDEKPHSLPEGSIIIRDKSRIIDLAGIMGGANSQITSQTKRILLTSASYNPKRIRSTSLKLAHRTQAATLFEKGIDPEVSLKVLSRAISLLKTANPHIRIASELTDIYPYKYKPQTVTLSHKLLEKYLGIPIKPSSVTRILGNLQIETSFSKTAKTYSAVIPSHRAKDITIEQDLVEEIARIYGYHRLPSILPPQLEKINQKQSQFVNENLIKKILVLHGFSEVYTSPIVSKDLLTSGRSDPKQTVRITNPLNENAFMRPTLIPSLAQAVELNLKYTPAFSLFELANTYHPLKLSPLPEEKMQFCLFSNQYPVSEFKGIIEQVFTRLGVKFIVDFGTERGEFDAEQSVCYFSGKTTLATLGITRNNPSLGIFAVIYSSELNRLAKPKVSFKPIPVYPPTNEDVTIQADIKTKIGTIVNKIKSVDPQITSVTYIEGFVKNQKIAHTFRIEIRNNKKTITKEESGRIKDKITKKFK